MLFIPVMKNTQPLGRGLDALISSPQFSIVRKDAPENSPKKPRQLNFDQVRESGPRSGFSYYIAPRWWQKYGRHGDILSGPWIGRLFRKISQ